MDLFYALCLSLLCCLACSLQPCNHLLGKARPLGSLVCRVFVCFVTFPYCVPHQVWYLIVSIPDKCLPLYVGSVSSLTLNNKPTQVMELKRDYKEPHIRYSHWLGPYMMYSIGRLLHNSHHILYGVNIIFL